MNGTELKKSDWVQNCVPLEFHQVVPSIGLYNHTHSFDLQTCIWNPTEHGTPGFLESLYTSFIEPIFLDITYHLDQTITSNSRHTGNPTECWYQDDDGIMIRCGN